MAAGNPRPRLVDILEAIVGVREAMGEMTLDEYRTSWTTRRAAERALEIISEASRHVPDAMKTVEADTPWREIAAIGNVLRHEYHRVDDEIVYTIVTQQLHGLEAAVRRLLNSLASNR